MGAASQEFENWQRDNRFGRFAMSDSSTLGQWFYQRFGRYTETVPPDFSSIPSWEHLSQDDQDYWEHEAQAATRAVVRGGFKQDPPAEQPPGLQERFFVKKINDPEGKHDKCPYFVLDPKHDPLAAKALSYYAALASDQPGLQELADDLRLWLTELRREEREKNDG